VLDYERHVASTFLPLVDAARHAVVTVGYVVVVVLTSMFAFHVAGWTVCRCLRLRLVLPARSTAAAALRRPGPGRFTHSTSIRSASNRSRPWNFLSQAASTEPL